MINMTKRRDVLVGLCALLGMGVQTVASAQAPSTAPKIAVTDLAYSERVSEYFDVTSIKAKSEEQSRLQARDGVYSSSMSGSHSSKQELDATRVTGAYSYIQQTELRNFTSDLKGMILKGAGARLVQGSQFDAGEPQPSRAEQVLREVRTGKETKLKRQPDLNDIVSRIRKGEFKGADYVLFGTVSAIEFRSEFTPIPSTQTVSYIFNLDLGADFNLINTRTLEVKAAFSSQGSGSDVKLMNANGNIVVPSRVKVIRETSQSLAEEAYGQLLEQLSLSDPNFGARARSRSSSGSPSSAPEARQPVVEPVTVFR